MLNRLATKIANITNGRPSDKLKIIGVSGSYGKTNVSKIVYQLLKHAGEKVGIITSEGYIDKLNTDQETQVLNYKHGQFHKILADMHRNGIEYVVMEINSKSLKEGKYNGIDFDSGIITNMTGSHLSYYKSIEDYLSLKLDFINMIKTEGLLITYISDSEIKKWLQDDASNKIERNIFIDIVEPKDLKDVKHNNDASEFTINNSRISIPLIGMDSIYNTVLSIKLTNAYLGMDRVLKSFGYINPPANKIRKVSDTPTLIYTDISPSTYSLEESLKYLNIIKKANSRIITILGGEGMIDPAYRWELGKIAASMSSILILCAFDPRTENVSDINNQLQQKEDKFNGIVIERIDSEDEYKYLNKVNLKSKIELIINTNETPVISFDANDYTSRLNAIDLAVKIAREDDIIYIPGKRTINNTLEFREVEYEWNDEEAIKKILESN